MIKFKTSIYQHVILMLMIADDEVMKQTEQMSNSKTTKMFQTDQQFNQIDLKLI